MYHRILVPVENSSYDERILDHVRQLARFCGASIVLIHVADGWAARNIQHLNLRESEEMRADREYIERLAATLSSEGLQAEAVLATGDPSAEIAAAAEREHCDLIAMSTHGHRFIADLIYGSVASAVRHMTSIPVLLLRAPAPAKQKTAVP
ncbi:MAG TPA: universal stress protein [Gemmatimonadaceae bacterium]|jgi:nucleotide-binding universal stress UspA family protein|nr:universal stress protein [Gemmatimonadaceae bacterium]